jgi:rubrerythrin
MAIADSVRDARETELHRLGSSKAVLAMTDAELETEAVLRAAAASEATAAATFEAWAEAEDDTDARAVWARAAEQERAHAERVAGALGGTIEEPEPDALHEYLRGLETTEERVGGFVGRCLVADRTLLQLVNFFVNEAEEDLAGLFRELRADTANALAWGESLAGEEPDEFDAAAEAVSVSYDFYVKSLGELGIDPTPVC